MIINFEYLDKMSTNRFMDFITGTIYSLNGSINQLSETLILIASEKTLVAKEQIKSKARINNRTTDEVVVNLINNN